jgi:hypothetical protein
MGMSRMPFDDDEAIPPEIETALREIGRFTTISEFLDHLGPADEIVDAPSNITDSCGLILRWHLYRERWPAVEVSVAEYADGSATPSAGMKDE